MKNLKSITAFLVVASMIMTSCGGNSSKKSSKADQKLGKLKVEIPAKLKSKPEVVSYINGMHEVADEYALIIDKIMEEAGHLVGVPEEDLTMMQKLKLVKLTAEVATKTTVTMAKWAEFQEQRISIEEQLTDAELEALNAVWTRFEERMMQIDKKYNGKLLKQDEE